MEFTKKLSLAKPLISDTFRDWLSAHNDNADKIDNFMQKQANYVTEEGDKDLWHYRKWSDGCCEMWCKKDYSFNTDVQWRGDYKYREYTLNFPFTFQGNPLGILTANSDEELYWVHSRYSRANYIKFYIFSILDVGAFSGSINCYIRGKLA